MRRHEPDHEGAEAPFERGPEWDRHSAHGPRFHHRGPGDPRDPRDARQGLRRGGPGGPFGPGGPGFGRGRPPFGFGPMPGGRARKGDMQAAILRLLDEESMHGYQIIGELASRSGGAWNPGPGSVYPTLQAMEDQELVQRETDGTRNVYSLTEKGKVAAASAGRGRPQSPWDEMAEASGPRVELRQAVHALIAASGQVERSASDEQIDKAIALIDQARKGLYLILAE